MTLPCELNEAIDAIEKQALQKHNVKHNALGLTPHRWSQVLRILKFARLRWHSMHADPAWYWREDRELSPYFIKGEDISHLKRYYRDNPAKAIEPDKYASWWEEKDPLDDVWAKKDPSWGGDGEEEFPL